MGAPAQCSLLFRVAFLVFADGSSDPATKIGYGAVLMFAESEIPSGNELERFVLAKRFYPTSSSRLELETVLWALETVPVGASEIRLFTDSQTIAGLGNRRASLESSRFRSKSGKLLKQGDLYRKFYDIVDTLEVTIEKLAGHKPRAEKGEMDRFFSMVDRASRLALRRELNR